MVTRKQSGVSTSVGTRLIGVINAGSSSLKFTFYDGERPIISGQVAGIGARLTATATGADGEVLNPPNFGAKPPATPSEVLPSLMLWGKEALNGRPLAALGHRVVHGGLRHARPERVTPELLAELETLIPLAPLHESHNLASIRAALAINPTLPQVACLTLHSTEVCQR